MRTKEEFEVSVELINLSTAGTLVSYRHVAGRPSLFSGGETVFLETDLSQLIERLSVRLYTFQSELARFQMRCRIVHTYEESETRRHYFGVALLDLARRREDLLHAVILKIQTFISSRGLV